MRNGPPGESPLKTRHCACCADAKARVSDLRDELKRSLDREREIEARLDRALADVARLTAAVEGQ
jgi:hypothetical protein